MENRRQTRRYQLLAEELEQTNQRLEQIQADARRSERLAALGQLSAGLAHEIRNPLGVIKGSAEMLNQKLESSNPLASELAGYISTEVNRLSALVTRFLDFARPLHLERTPQRVAGNRRARVESRRRPHGKGPQSASSAIFSPACLPFLSTKISPSKCSSIWRKMPMTR